MAKVIAGFLALGSVMVAFNLSADERNIQQAQIDVQKEKLLARYFIVPLFDILDCEHVGKIEAGEVDEHLPQLFHYHDRDQSKTITEREFVSQKGSDSSLNKNLFQLMDSGRDGVVTVREYRHYMAGAIQSMDMDGDGEVSRAELGMPPRVQKRLDEVVK